MPKKTQKGRPTKLTEKTVRLIEACLQSGASITQTCYEAGISRETFHKWMRESSDFSDRIKQAPDHLVKLAKKNILNAVACGDIKTSQWVIEKFAVGAFSPVDMKDFSNMEAEEDPLKDIETWASLIVQDVERRFMEDKYVCTEDAEKMRPLNTREHAREEEAEDREIWSTINGKKVIEDFRKS